MAQQYPRSRAYAQNIPEQFSLSADSGTVMSNPTVNPLAESTSNALAHGLHMPSTRQRAHALTEAMIKMTMRLSLPQVPLPTGPLALRNVKSVPGLARVNSVL